VLSIGKSNAMKKQLNAYCQWHRIDPDEIEVVSDDEPEDTMPDITDFLSFPHTAESGTCHGPSADPPDSCPPSESDNCAGPSGPLAMLAPPNPGTVTSFNAYTECSYGIPSCPTHLTFAPHS